jgi:DNA-binding response OmpR family regulator
MTTPAATQCVSVPTVFLVGIDELAQIPHYLDLGAVVVVAPDPRVLQRWRWEQERQGAPDAPGQDAPQGVVVDLPGRRISSRGLPLNLSDMEFRVLAALVADPPRALSFRQLRRLGWGDGPELPVDAYSVRSLIQRLRAKLRAVEAPVGIAAVRGFGFRVETINASMKESAVAAK